MDISAIVLVVFGLLLLVKAITSSIKAAIAEAKRRIELADREYQITEPARSIAAAERRLPYKEIGVTIVALTLITIGVVNVIKTRADRVKRDDEMAKAMLAAKARVPEADGTMPSLRVAGASMELAKATSSEPPLSSSPMELQAAELVTAQTVELMQNRVAKIHQKNALDLARRVVETVNALRADMDIWDNLVSELATGDRGKALAAQPDLVASYRALVLSERTDPTFAADLQLQAEALVEPIELAYVNPLDIAQPDSKVLEELAALLVKARDARKQFIDAKAATDSLLSKALQRGAPGTEQLGTTLQSLASVEAAETLRIVEEARNKQLAEGRILLAEREADLLKAEQEAEAAKLEALAKRVRDEIQAAKEDAAKQAVEEQRRRERAEHERLAKDPAVQAKFRCFLDKGYVLYSVHPEGSLPKGTRPQAVSFKDLNDKGWLRDTDTFAKAMAGQGNPDLYNNVSDRTRYPTPRTPAEWEDMERLFELFKKVGPIWVEMKLLEP